MKRKDRDGFNVYSVKIVHLTQRFSLWKFDEVAYFKMDKRALIFARARCM